MIYLDFAGKEVPANLKDESTFRSKHTGAELKSIKVDIVAEDQEAHERLLKSIEKGSINSTDGKGSVLSKWKVKNPSYSYTDAPGSHYYHSLELEETEELRVSSLTLGGFSLQPYSYEEKFDGDALIIEARVLLSETQYVELKKLMKAAELYFPVVRHGISEEPREMRFGKMLWSKHEDGIKHELLLVEKIYDETKERRSALLFEPEMSHVQDMTAQQEEILEELITALVDKGLLRMEEINDIRARATRRTWERKREFYRVDDIDTLTQ